MMLPLSCFMALALLEIVSFSRHSSVTGPYCQVQVIFTVLTNRGDMGICHEAEPTRACRLLGSPAERQLGVSRSLTFMFTNPSPPPRLSPWKFSDV